VVAAGWHRRFDAVSALVKAGSCLDLRTHAGLTRRALAMFTGVNKSPGSLKGRADLVTQLMFLRPPKWKSWELENELD